MDFSPTKRPYNNLIAEKDPIDFFEFFFKGIMVHLIADENERTHPLVFIVSFFDLEYSAEPGIIMVIVLYFFCKLYYYF